MNKTRTFLSLLFVFTMGFFVKAEAQGTSVTETLSSNIINPKDGEVLSGTIEFFAEGVHSVTAGGAEYNPEVELYIDGVRQTEEITILDPVQSSGIVTNVTRARVLWGSVGVSRSSHVLTCVSRANGKSATTHIFVEREEGGGLDDPIIGPPVDVMSSKTGQAVQGEQASIQATESLLSNIINPKDGEVVSGTIEFIGEGVHSVTAGGAEYNPEVELYIDGVRQTEEITILDPVQDNGHVINTTHARVIWDTTEVSKSSHVLTCVSRANGISETTYIFVEVEEEWGGIDDPIIGPPIDVMSSKTGQAVQGTQASIQATESLLSNIINPEAGEVVKGTIEFFGKGIHTVTGSSVTYHPEVELYIDGIPQTEEITILDPVESSGSVTAITEARVIWDTSEVSVGTHTLTCVARANGKEETTEIYVLVEHARGGGQVPVIETLTSTIMKPKSGDTVKETVGFFGKGVHTVTIGGTEYSPDVELYIDGVRQEEQTTKLAPFQSSGSVTSITYAHVQWDTSAVAAGTHTLTCVARANGKEDTTNIYVLVEQQTVHISTIGPNGGIIEDQNNQGASVSIDPGVLEEEESIRISTVAAPSGDTQEVKLAGEVVEFCVVGNEHGYKFSQPVEISIPFDPSQVTEVRRLGMAWWNEQEKEWDLLPSRDVKVDEKNNCVIGHVDHFSIFSVVEVPQAPLGADLPVGEVYSYPNPAKAPQPVVFRLESAMADFVQVQIYDLVGNLVGSKTESTGLMIGANGGIYQEVSYDTQNMATGTYVAVIEARNGDAGKRITHKFMVIR